MGTWVCRRGATGSGAVTPGRCCLSQLCRSHGAVGLPPGTAPSLRPTSRPGGSFSTPGPLASSLEELALLFCPPQERRDRSSAAPWIC